ncbi:MAG: hypothetical protein ACTH0V_00315 [Microbacteriaceae bacterium]
MPGLTTVLIAGAAVVVAGMVLLVILPPIRDATRTRATHQLLLAPSGASAWEIPWPGDPLLAEPREAAVRRRVRRATAVTVFTVVVVVGGLTVGALRIAGA